MVLGGLTRPDPRAACIEWLGSKNSLGYATVVVSYVNVGVHRLALAIDRDLSLAEIEGMVVMHLCDNPPCINPAHLQLGTQQENMIDCSKKGRIQSGSRHWLAKLDAEAVAYIVENHVPGVGPFRRGNTRELADRFGVSMATIGRVVRGESWY